MRCVRKSKEKETFRGHWENIRLSEGGITLVEALVTVLIFSIILGACYMILISGSDSYEANEVRVGLHQELRKALDWISQDLRQTGSALSAITDVPADGSWYASITFHKVSGVSGGAVTWEADTTKYFLGGAGGNQLQRQVGLTTAAVVAQDIQSLQFRRTAGSSDIVEVALQAQKMTLRGKSMTGKAAIQADLNFKVHLRN